MKKKLFILAVLLCSCFALKAQDFTNNGLNYSVTGTNPPTLELTGHANGYTTHDLVIPSAVIYKGTIYSVTSIKAWAFAYYDGFTGSLTIPNSVETIGKYAFYRCSSFSGTLTIGNAVTIIDEMAFAYCSGFTGSLTIPDSVESIEKEAFYECSGFNGSLTLGNGLTRIGYDVFNKCSGFTGTLTFGNSLIDIGKGAFYECSHLTGPLTIPNTVTGIGESAFAYCSGFTGSLAIPNAVTSIGKNAFYECSHLTGTLTIGNAVTNIGEFAFFICGFSQIIAKPACPPILGTRAFDFINFQSIIVPCGKSNFYKEEKEGNNWKDYADKITEGFVSYDLNVASANPESGTASITQSATCENSQASVTATPNHHCMFTGWTENGTLLSTENPYTFNLESDRNLVANFLEYTYVYEPISALPSPINPDDIYALGYQEGNNYYLHTTGTEIGGMQLSSNPADPVEYHFMFFSEQTTSPFVYAYCDSGKCLRITDSGVSTNGILNPMEPSPYTLDIQNGDISSAAAPGHTVCHDVNIITTHTGTSEGNLRFFKCTVKPLYHIAVSANPEEAGTVTATCGGEPVELAIEGTNIAVSVSPTDNYKFLNWTENGTVVSTANPYIFTLTNNRNLVANFIRNYDFSATCETGQTLYYRIINAEQHWVSIVAPNSDDHNGWVGIAQPEGAITLPETVKHNGVSYTVLTISTYAFYYCLNLTGQLTIPNSVISIGSQAFEYCSGFNGSLTIPNSVTNIAKEAFAYCSKFTGSLSIPNSVTSIGDGAFAGCLGFNGSLVIPNSVTGIEKNAFFGCSGFTGKLSIPSSVTSIGESAFYNCSGFTNPLTIPNTVTSIGERAFYECLGFTGALTIGNAVTSIGESAFYKCSGFTGALTIGNAVTSIGDWAFAHCNFNKIISKAQNAPSLASKIPDATNKVYIPTGTLQSYQDRWDSSYEYEFVEYREDYHFNGTGSEWNTAANWEENEVPYLTCHHVFVNTDCQVDADAEVGTITVAGGKKLTINTGKTITADGIILENGAQLINNGTVACNDLTVKKDIAGYGTGTGGWYLVSSPVAIASFPADMTYVSYDLFRFSQTGDSQGREWLNYKAERFGNDNQSGYLYANRNNMTIAFRGDFAATGTKTLAYDADAEFPGFNLVGNPYPCNATISGENLGSSNYYYMMNAGGTNLEVVAEPVLAPCTGVFAVAASSEATVTFTPTTANANVTRGEKNSLQDIRVELLANGKVIDRAFLNMNGESLPKFRLQDNASEICFYQDKEELAVASTDATRGEMPLNFKAAKNGSYTISVNTENADLNYLHLVDNLTGNDVDLLGSEGDVPWRVSTYTFEAKTNDYASRFKLVFGVKDENSEASGNFAYISNGEIIISNEGRATLQVIDVMGRIVSSEEINGECRISTNGMTAGLYILNLNGMTQKIVVE